MIEPSGSRCTASLADDCSALCLLCPARLSAAPASSWADLLAGDLHMRSAGFSLGCRRDNGDPGLPWLDTSFRGYRLSLEGKWLPRL